MKRESGGNDVNIKNGRAGPCNPGYCNTRLSLKGVRADMINAAAMLIAEIERLYRAGVEVGKNE